MAQEGVPGGGQINATPGDDGTTGTPRPPKGEQGKAPHEQGNNVHINPDGTIEIDKNLKPPKWDKE